MQLEEALAEAKAEQEAQALAALELHAAFAERKAQTQAKEEALGASNEDGRCLAERIAVLEASLEESARELLSAQVGSRTRLSPVYVGHGPKQNASDPGACRRRQKRCNAWRQAG